jgi:hypothetical protein
MLAKQVIDGVDDLLQDTAGVRWPRVQRMRWLNEGQLAIVALRPDAKSVTRPLTLVDGDQQTLPAEAIRLLDILRNQKGRGVTLVSREVMTDLTTSWFTDTPASVIKHYTYDPRLPKEYEVFPPAKAGTILIGRYSLIPVPCATEDSPLDIDDTFAPALVRYIAANCFMKNTETDDQGKAQAHMSNFALLLTGNAAAQKGEDPNANQPNRIKPATI